MILASWVYVQPLQECYKSLTSIHQPFRLVLIHLRSVLSSSGVFSAPRECSQLLTSVLSPCGVFSAPPECPQPLRCVFSASPEQLFKDALSPANSLSAFLGTCSASWECSQPFRCFQLPRLSVLHLPPLEDDSWIFLRWEGCTLLCLYR